MSRYMGRILRNVWSRNGSILKKSGHTPLKRKEYEMSKEFLVKATSFYSAYCIKMLN